MPITTRRHCAIVPTMTYSNDPPGPRCGAPAPLTCRSGNYHVPACPNHAGGGIYLIGSLGYGCDPADLTAEPIVR